MVQWKDRIVGFEKIPANKLIANPANYRKHNEAQRRALRAVFQQIGIVDAAIVRKLDDGNYEVIDGHLRRELHDTAQVEVPCLITDLNEEEANAVLATYHPIGEMAGTQIDAFGELVKRISLQDEELLRHIRHLAQLDRTDKSEEDPEYPIVAQFSESYSYLLVMVKNEVDWIHLEERLSLQPKVCMFNPQRVGIGHVLQFDEFCEKLDKLEGKK